MRRFPAKPVVALLVGLTLIPAGVLSVGSEPQARRATGAGEQGWPCYGHDPGGTRYSQLDLINRENVGQLRVAWTYRTGDVSDGKNGETSQFEATPIMIWGRLYVATPFDRVIALDPASGKEMWAFDPKIDLSLPYGDGLTCRGVAAWEDDRSAARETCRRRVFIATNDGRLIALDSDTGKLCAGFGSGGQIALRLARNKANPGEYHFTSPPAVYRDLVIVGSAISDNERADAPSGIVRAFDARSGKPRWSWEPLERDRRRAGSKGIGGPAKTGAANVWSILSVDEARDLVFLPTSSPSPDFYGGERPGNNRYSDSVVALRASTGKLVWSFQVVHHDVWDYDVPAQPLLITLRRTGKRVPAVVIATKMGHIFVLDRRTGKPLFPVEERAVPQEGVEGEALSPTQPFPKLPPPLSPDKLTKEDAWGITEADREWCRGQIGALRSEGIFTPPSLQGSIIFPGNIGGAHWGGAAFDPARSILIVNTNRFPFVVRLMPRERYEEERRAHPHADLSPQAGTPYAVLRDVLRTPRGVLCNPPPWGVLTAIDLARGALRWEAPLGTVPSLAGLPGAAQWGSPNLGGSIITRGGLIFVAAAMDKYLRAIDLDSGRELWKAPLPASAQATPMTYSVNNRQYIVIAAGGHGRLGTELGDYVVAFALP